jgi:precorrin-2 dehydrogenase/sirohydrochlorin ferrochelatase
VKFAYPLMLDVTDRTIVIVGGGAVAARKAKTLIECGATCVRAVAPSFVPQMHSDVQRIAETYRAEHLDGAKLVFAATDSPQVNERVVRDAQARGVLVNRVDDGEPGGDFVVPARFQEGEVIVSVTAGSAALAATIRNELGRRLDPRHVKLAGAMKTLRPAIRDSGLEADRRTAVFRDLASDQAVATVDTGGIDALRRWIAARHPGLKL